MSERDSFERMKGAYLSGRMPVGKMSDSDDDMGLQIGSGFLILAVIIGLIVGTYVFYYSQYVTFKSSHIAGVNTTYYNLPLAVGVPYYLSTTGGGDYLITLGRTQEGFHTDFPLALQVGKCYSVTLVTHPVDLLVKEVLLQYCSIQ